MLKVFAEKFRFSGLLRRSSLPNSPKINNKGKKSGEDTSVGQKSKGKRSASLPEKGSTRCPSNDWLYEWLGEASLPSDEAINRAASAHLLELLHKHTSLPPIKNERQRNSWNFLFDERVHPVNSKCVNGQTPSVEDISSFLKRFQRVGWVHSVSVVLSMHFLDLVLHKTPSLRVTVYTWKQLLIACLILATKVYEELGVKLSDFASHSHFRFLTMSYLNIQERTLLSLLDFETFWTYETYMSYLLKWNLLTPEQPPSIPDQPVQNEILQKQDPIAEELQPEGSSTNTHDPEELKEDLPKNTPPELPLLHKARKTVQPHKKTQLRLSR